MTTTGGPTNLLGGKNKSVALGIMLAYNQYRQKRRQQSTLLVGGAGLGGGVGAAGGGDPPLVDTS